MAVMWPRTLPADVVNTVLRSTECTVFRQLEAELDNSFAVFYSRPWHGLTWDGEEIDGECDFIVAHAKLGMLALEVKGGGVGHDPRTDLWTSRDRWKILHKIKDPVDQARKAKYALLDKLKDSPDWKARRIRVRHGVVLPHSSIPLGDLGPDRPLCIFCFAERFENGFRDWILERFVDKKRTFVDKKRTFVDKKRTEDLGLDGMCALRKLLAKPFELRISLGRQLAQDDADIQTLTCQQAQVLGMIQEIPRAAVKGPAGTGKTVLAMEEAVRCAENGARTLFVCYNHPLAKEVEHRLSNKDLPVSVKTFHELCSHLTTRAEITTPTGYSDRKLFDEIYPELLIQAFERLPEDTYDAIIVDEGQDFLPLWWSAVEAGLNPDGKKIIRVFFDNNQRVYASAGSIPEDVTLVPISLGFNLRNTKRIYEVVCQHYRGPKISVAGPPGVDVKWIKVADRQSLERRISECVINLVNVEQVSEEDIAILVSTEKVAEEFMKISHRNSFRTCPADRQSKKCVVVDSIRRFKGLERRVVIIAGTPEIVTDIELPYVGLSRARTHLIIIGEDMTLRKIRGATGLSAGVLTD